MTIVNISEPEATLVRVRKQAIGIDLGTTYSLLAIATEAGAEVIARTSSIVNLGDVKNSYYIGDRAREKDENYLSSFKRYMSSDLSFSLSIGEEKFSPIFLSSLILKSLKEEGERKLGTVIGEAVITVPAYFDDMARKNTIAAAKLAGIEVLRLINEPTAASLSYGLESSAEGLFLIYDFGGGTFDATILKLDQGVFKVIATAGDLNLGGDDIDKLIVEEIFQEELNNSNLLKAKLYKEEVSNNPNSIEAIKLKELATPIFIKTCKIVDNTLLNADLEMEDIDEVILVGGSTKSLIMKEYLRNYYKRNLKDDINPDEIVAIGAALQADALLNGAKHLLLDVNPLTIGLEVAGGLVDRIIERNSTLPIQVTKEFTTEVDGQSGIIFRIVQGERGLAKENRLLGEFTLTGIVPLPAFVPRIKVVFRLDADGILSVKAEDEKNGVSEELTICPSFGLTMEDIMENVYSAIDHFDEDKELAAKLELKHTIVTTIEIVRRALNILQVDNNDLVELLSQLEVSVEKNFEIGELEAMLETLEREARPIIEELTNSKLKEELYGVGLEALKKKLV